MKTLANETNKATILDVARMADVSIKTVSRVANGQPNVRDETRARVQRAIDLLGYSANPYAKHMGSQSRPPARQQRGMVISSGENTSATENGRQDKTETNGIAASVIQRDSTVTNSDRDIDWW